MNPVGSGLGIPESAREEDVPADTTVETTKVLCKDSVLTVFPNICPAYLEEITSEHAYDADTVVSVILDKLENGQLYPTQPHSNPLKRKRDNEGQDEMEAGGEPEAVRAVREQIDKADYVLKVASPAYQDLAKKLLSHDFPLVPALTLRNLQLSHRQSLYLTYTAMDDALDNWDNANPLWKDKKTPSRPADDFSADRLSSLDMSKYSPEEQAAFAELRAARDLRAVKHAKAAAKSEEEANFASAQREGQTAECGCCFEECALNRMIRCNGETVHWFCRDCMRSQAETVIGLSKWELTCMSMDSCSAGFSANQRPLFLDKKLGTALDRIEQEAMLRMAGIENLESCPFCPYAAEYPPVEVDKEFRCDNEDCYRVSCRLCRKETHIPKTCEEVAIEEGGGDARHALEEAMSAALIRTCNKCRNPFMKEDGCNKILCTRCQTLHCYVCRKTITGYQHFNDKKRGGKDGQCPLFDSTEERHQQEVERAEKEALEKVAKENPDVDANALRVKVSDKVREDELRRKQNASHRGRPFRVAGGPGIPLPRVAEAMADLRRRARAHRLKQPGDARNALVQVQPPRPQPAGPVPLPPAFAYRMERLNREPVVPEPPRRQPTPLFAQRIHAMQDRVRHIGRDRHENPQFPGVVDPFGPPPQRGQIPQPGGIVLMPGMRQPTPNQIELQRMAVLAAERRGRPYLGLLDGRPYPVNGGASQNAVPEPDPQGPPRAPEFRRFHN